MKKEDNNTVLKFFFQISYQKKITEQKLKKNDAEKESISNDENIKE